MANTALQLQKLANKNAKEIQTMVNAANQATLAANAKESKLAREFNSKEAATARTFNAAEAGKERAFNAQEAATARDWQKMMSDTSHQREVADLRKAGLNPVLSAGAGAQSYTTSSASAGAASSPAASASGIGSSLDSGAGAYGSIFGSLMNTIAGLKQTQMSSAASLKAAQLSAEASKYVADKNYAGVVYSSDKAYEKEMDKPQGSPFALFDKYLGKAGVDLKKEVNDLNWSNIRVLNKNANGSYNVTGKYTREQKTVINKGLLKLGYNRGWLDTLSNKKLLAIQDAYYMAFVKNDKKLLKEIKNVNSMMNQINHDF